MKPIAITVGIPVHNEEKNIYRLIKSILSQEGVTLREIIVADDGSTDKTLQEVAKAHESRVTILSDKKRNGKTRQMQKIIQKNRGDVLIFMDGDVVINDKKLFKKTVQHVVNSDASLITVHTQPLPPKNYLQRALYASMHLQDYLKKEWNKGDNFLTCKGNMLLLKKEFAKKITFPSQLVNDDAYIYFLAKSRGLRVVYADNVSIYYQLPVTISDHNKQSIRFQISKIELKKHFAKNILVYTYPKSLFFSAFVRTFIRQHIYLILYIVISLLSRLPMKASVKATWNMARTTKGATYV